MDVEISQGGTAHKSLAVGRSSEPTTSVADSALDSVSVVAEKTAPAEALRQVGGKRGKAVVGTEPGGRTASPGPTQPKVEVSKKDTNVPCLAHGRQAAAAQLRHAVSCRKGGSQRCPGTGTTHHFGG